MTTRQSARKARQLFRLCLVDGRVDENRMRLVVGKILQSKSRDYLILLRQVLRWLKLEHGRHTAEIESAVALPMDLQTKVRVGLERLYGPELTALFSANPKLIGGMRIKVGCDVYDSSIRSGLAALARSFGITSENGWDAKA